MRHRSTTQLAHMSFDEIFDLVPGVYLSYTCTKYKYVFFDLSTHLHPAQTVSVLMPHRHELCDYEIRDRGTQQQKSFGMVVYLAMQCQPQ